MAIDTDKDGGMGLISIDDCRQVLDEVIQRPEYMEVAWATASNVQADANRTCVALAARIEKVMDVPGMSTAIRRYMNAHKATCISNLQNNYEN